MKTKIGLYLPFVTLMKQRGYSCIVYDYPPRLILEPTLTDWKQFFDDIIVDAQSRLQLLKQQGATSFYAYGVSFGTLIANKFSRDTPVVTHVILSLSYGDVAANIWSYRGVEPAKRSLMLQGHNEKSVRRHIKYADPIVNAHGLKGKKVLLQLSKTDKVIPYEQALHTLQAFKEANIDLVYTENKYLGHYFGGIKNALSIRLVDKFLSS